MDDPRLRVWETLFARAQALLDAVGDPSTEPANWSFGGGTVLMRRHRHRFSKDIDIFVPDPQWLGYLTPRLSDAAEALTTDYAEDAMSLKLRFAEGEIDFIASTPLTPSPYVVEEIMGRKVNVETTSEIIAKKVWHRGDRFTARDMLDLAMVAEREAEALDPIRPILAGRGQVILRRIESLDARLREDYAALERMEFMADYEDCVSLVRAALG